MLTQQLMRTGLIKGEQRGREWFFWADESATAQLPPAGRSAGEGLRPRDFEALARRVLSDHYGVTLSPGSVGGVRKEFDFVSSDERIVGDAKYYTRVGGSRLPPAKFSAIAEHVWLLEKTGASIRFLVFGNDRQVPIMWLKRYSNLVSGVTFYFLTDDGRLEELANPRHLGRHES